MTDRIQLAHGGGGRLGRELIEREILSRFHSPLLQALPDAASLEADGGLIFSTDSFVVSPYAFPGGNIGDLAVHGTVNDISAAGGRPRWLSLALIIEEGLLIDDLRTILDSVAAAAQHCGVDVVTGDTKVVARGQADGIFINTAGIGTRLEGFDLSPSALQPGDRILINGGIGEHGLAVMSVREDIHVVNGPTSDSAPVHELVAAIAEWAPQVRFMRDPTRGGLAAVANEMVEGQDIGLLLDEPSIPLAHGVKGVAEMLGLDPLTVACEGRLVLVCSAEAAEPICQRWRALENGESSCCIGEVVADGRGRVVLRTQTGGTRLVDVPRGELLPRIC